MQTLNEELLSSYLFFGWIDPKGKLILPTVEDKNSPHIILHADLLDGKNINEMFKQGYIRFLIEKKSPKQITYFTKNLEKVNLVTFFSGIKEIENLIATNKVNPKVFPYPIPLPENHVFEYEKNLQFREIPAHSPQELKRKLERTKLRLSQSLASKNYQTKLEESLGLDPFYSVWGWITPKGELLLPTKEMKNTKGMIFTHEDILPFSKYPPSIENINKNNKAYKKGYIRWFIEFVDPNTLVLSADKERINPHILSIGIEKIEKYLTQRPDEVFPRKPEFVFDYLLDFVESYIRAKTKNDLVNKLKNMLNSNKPAEIKESIYSKLKSSYAGWASPDGKVFFDWNDSYDGHSGMINDLGRKVFNDNDLDKGNARQKGYTRLIIDTNSLRLNPWFEYIQEIGKDNWLNLVSKIIRNAETEIIKGEKVQIPKNISIHISGHSTEAEEKEAKKYEIESELDSQFLRRYKTKIEQEQLLNEFFELDEYLAWGWVTNKNKLIIPTQKMKDDEDIPFTHHTILPKNFIGKDPLKLGFLRWFIEKSPLTKELVLFMECYIPAINKEDLSAKINIIESYLQKHPDFVFPDKPPYVDKYHLDYFSEKNVNIKEITANTKRELLYKFEEIWEKQYQPKQKINEAFPMEKYYLAWGWVDVPNHYKLILPTLQMKNSNATFYHADILPDEEDEIKAFGNKKVKWSLEKTLGMNKLFVTVDLRVSKQELIRAINTIEKFLDSEKGREIFPHKSGVIEYYIVEYLDADRSSISALSKQELFNKIRNFQIESLQTNLNEYFEMDDWYLVWGWATPNGKLILPTLAMKKHPIVNYTHNTMIDVSKTHALLSGYIRWFIEYGYENLPKLVMQFLDNVEYNTIVKTIQNIEKLLASKPTPVFPNKPTAIFKYQAELPGKFITGENKSEFLRKIKIALENDNDNDDDDFLTEFFGMDGFYLAWGWITPKGELLLPKKEDKESEKSVVHLLFLQQYYPKYESILEALNDGFVRWHIEKGEVFPDLWMSFMPHKIQPEMLKKGIEKIQTFLKKQPDPIFPKKPEFFDKIQTTFYFYPKKDSEFYRFSSVGQLLNKVKKERLLNEMFAHSSYLSWGIVTKKGKLVKPTLKQKNDSTFFIHSDIIPKSEGIYFSIDDYIKDGGIRWFIEKDREGNDILVIDVNKKIDNQRIINAVKDILNDMPDEVFPNKPLQVNQIIIFRESDEILAKNLTHLKNILKNRRQ